MDKQSSDERLLKLIEGQYVAGPGRGQVVLPQGQKQAGKKARKGLSLPDIKSGLKFIKLDILSVNKGLVFFVVLLTLIFFYVLLTPPGVSKAGAVTFSASDTAQIQKLINSGQEQLGARRNISLQEVKRNFFLPFGIKEGGYTPQQEKELEEELKAIKLVGIIWSQDPEVMIENQKDSRTYILKKGESLNNIFKVKNISRNSATLEISAPGGVRDYELR